MLLGQLSLISKVGGGEHLGLPLYPAPFRCANLQVEPESKKISPRVSGLNSTSSQLRNSLNLQEFPKNRKSAHKPLILDDWEGM